MGLLRLMGNKADVVKGLAKRCVLNLTSPRRARRDADLLQVTSNG